MTDIQYENMRNELMDYILELASPELQRTSWGVVGEPTSTFDYSVHFLFDDTELASAPHSCIGILLKNSKEADAINTLTCEIENLFKLYGTELEDKDYISKPEWASVVRSAKYALIEMQKS